MNKLRKQLNQIHLFKLMSSVKIAVVCLVLLLILTFWGTIAQVQNGLYYSQQRFFFSLYFLVFGFFPFPGARLVLWVLFINLVCGAIRHFVFLLQNIGILIIHFGLLTYFVGAFLVFNLAQESHLTLREGQGANVTTSYHDWELSVWQDSATNKHHVYAVDLNNPASGASFPFTSLGFTVTTETYYPNAQAYVEAEESKKQDFQNASGIKEITLVASNKEPEKNIPAGIFKINFGNTDAARILLYGGEVKPTKVAVGGKAYNFELRRKHFQLPFTLTLKDVEMQVHPGTTTARSYQSKVVVDYAGVSRETLIYMNNPLRYRNFTLYQATYAVDAMGREISTLAVVRNSAKWMPYISCFITFFGLATHFLLRAFKSRHG